MALKDAADLWTGGLMDWWTGGPMDWWTDGPMCNDSAFIGALDIKYMYL